MSEQITQAEQEFNKAIDFLHSEIDTIRSGRAHPSVVDGISVDAYGTKTPLVQLASINVPEPRVITIQPWDKGVIGEIEKAIREADIGINPVNEGDVIRLVIPQLTEEARKDLVKILHQKLEQARIAIRQVRDKIKEEIINSEKNKEITEDDKFDLLKKLDEKTGEFNDKIKNIGVKKEEDVMRV